MPFRFRGLGMAESGGTEQLPGFCSGLYRASLVDWGPGPQVVAEQEMAAVDIINDGEWVP